MERDILTLWEEWESFQAFITTLDDKNKIYGEVESCFRNAWRTVGDRHGKGGVCQKLVNGIY